MFTALVSPEYAERHNQEKIFAEGGFIAHGIVPANRDTDAYTGWFYALLPGSPEEANREQVRPLPAEDVASILRAERDRYNEMALSDGDSVWADAARRIDDMLYRLECAAELSAET
ncbi:hypothetical protein LRD18_05650 [Halorhodospira halochloris]|uniref:Uncharacterized protein n=1 Tax=Halorhodospira halochloris TaxID=1052 RepID=A0A0X8XBA3_HALHR|nr:hypothetical protein [Halorhodospira halochloris]MBK1651942.1 hypothetical protein [Halorhodospira halochloris]MCG5530357.1 hypothetical protein [Halorhodospira halochloris]BAU58233.1 hypothetical protein HH1059_15270 [Halorhodospira halochloris]